MRKLLRSRKLRQTSSHHALVELDGTSSDFSRRLDSIGKRHSRKHGFIFQLKKLT
jgi:hypothetical protein